MAYRGSRKGNYGTRKVRSFYFNSAKGSGAATITKAGNIDESKPVYGAFLPKKTKPFFLSNDKEWVEAVANHPQNKGQKIRVFELKTQKPSNEGNKITVIRNRFGHLHVFSGNQDGKLTDLGSNILLDGKESDLYVQTDTDIESFKEFMTPKQRRDLDDGYEVVIDNQGWL